MNVQAFFQQTSSRVLYTMTSKAHGYGVEEAITSSSKASLRRAARQRRYIRTTQWRRHGSAPRRRRLSCQIPHEWNCCQQLPNASLSFSSSFAVTLLDLTLCLSSSRLLTCARGALRLTITTSSSKLESKFKSELVCCRRARRRRGEKSAVVCRQLYDRHRKRGTNVLLKG